MTGPERSLSLSHREQSPISLFQESYPSSDTSKLRPSADTSKPQGESASPKKEALPNQGPPFHTSSDAKSYDHVILNDQKPRSQFPAQLKANVPLRPKQVAAKATQANERIKPVIITYPANDQAPAPTSNQYTKPTDSQLFTKDISYKLFGTIYCECKPPLPARRLGTQTTEADHGREFYGCPKAIDERCKFLVCDDGAKDGGEAAMPYGTCPERPPSPPSRAPSETPPYTLALLCMPSVSKREISDPTSTTYIMSKTSDTRHSPPA